MADHTQLPRSQKVMTMVGTLLGLLLAALDQTIVSTAGPAIQRDLHILPSFYTWLTTSYLVASAVMTPVWGKLSDLFGRRRILVQGIAVFLAGSLLCGVSQNTTQLIAARVVQGLGSAALFTTAFAVLADIFAPRERGRYAGLFGAVFGLSSVIGPLVGGLITDTIGWHWCFFINLPVGAIALGVILTRMPALAPDGGRGGRRLDLAGAATFALAIVPLLVALSLAKVELHPGDVGYPWRSPLILGLAAAALGFGGLFVFVERRAAEPMIDLRMFGNRAFALGNLASFVVGLAFLGAIVFLPLFMVNVVGASATRAGLTTTPLTFGIVVGNVLSGNLSSRLGRYKFLILGSLAVLTTGFAVMAFTLSPEVTSMGMSARMVLIGLGLGPSIPLFNVHISSAVPLHQIGAATSTATLARSLGSTVGIAIFGNLFGLALAHGMEAKLAAATAGMPPEAKAQWAPRPGGGGGGEEAGPSRPSFDAATATRGVRESFARQRGVVEAALGKDDPAAIAELARAPGLDPRTREVLAAGGLARSVGAGFDAVEARVAAALAAGAEAPAALAVLAADPALPAPARDALTAATPEAVATAEGRAALAARVAEALAGARAQALAGARKGLEDGEARALATVAKIGRALKEAFAEATAHVYFVAIFFAIAGLLVSMLLPELPLRGGPGGPGGRGAAPPALE